jgi:cell division septal protein FtsQ
MSLRRSLGRGGVRRRTGKVKSNALIARLRGDRRSLMKRDRNAVRLTPERVGRFLRRPEVQLALVGVFVLVSLLGVLVSGPVVHGLAQLFARDALRLDSIEVLGNRRLTPQEVALATGLSQHTRIDEIEPAEIVARLTDHPWIRDAAVSYWPSASLLVRIEERKPLVAVASRPAGEEEDVWYLVDRDGVAFALASALDRTGLPRLRSDQTPLLGRRDPRLVEAIAVTSRFPVLALEDESPTTPQALELPSDANDAGWVLHFEAPERRVILGDDGLETRLERLALLLDADLEATRAAEVIDLRFKDRAILRSVSASP